MRGLLALAALAALAGCGGRARPVELARQPYAGVACREANTTGCDRVGLAVWLKGPARRVEATIGGRPLSLAPPAGGRDYRHGFLRPAGLASGRLRPAAPVRVTVRVDGGTPLSVRTRLHEGWG